MKTTVNFAALACTAALVASAAFSCPAAAVDMSGYEKGRLAPISQKSFEDLRDLTDRRIAEIRATPNLAFDITTDWFGNTNVRYVSAAGDDDKNNGQTPEKPWKTIQKVNDSVGWGVEYVCFRRGDVFRGSIKAKSGVTYTAYGDKSKPKPCIYASTKNGANPAEVTFTYREITAAVTVRYIDEATGETLAPDKELTRPVFARLRTCRDKWRSSSAPPSRGSPWA